MFVKLPGVVRIFKTESGFYNHTQVVSQNKPYSFYFSRENPVSN